MGNARSKRHNRPKKRESPVDIHRNEKTKDQLQDKQQLDDKQIVDNSFPLWGVQLSFLHKWTLENVTDVNETTSELCNRVVLPLTRESKTSLIEFWGMANKKANRFISHSWSYRFSNVISTIIELETNRGSNLDDVYIWMDTLVVNQHEAPVRTQSWWSSTFHQAIKEIGRVILVIEPWHSPKALTRAWCLWEIYGCAQYQADFSIGLASAEKAHFLTTLIKDFKGIQKMLSLVDSRKAEASNASDLEMIRGAIESSIGYEGVNRMVLTKIRGWLVETAREALEENSIWASHIAALEDISATSRKALLHNQLAKLYHLQGELKLAFEHQQEAFKLDLTESGDDSDQVARDLNNLGYLSQKMGNLEAAAEYLDRALQIRIKRSGEDAPEVARTRYNIGEIFETQGKLDECVQSYHASASSLLKADMKEDALKVYQGLGRVHRMQGDFKSSEKSFLKALELGGKDSVHPDVAEVWGLYAALLTDTDRFKEAEQALDQARAVQVRNLGETHPNVADIENNFARLLSRMGRYEDALKRQKAALEIDRRAFGESHLEVSRDHNNLGFLLMQLSRLKEAQEHMTRALEIRKSSLGENHPLYARSLCNAASVEVLMGDYTGALAKYEQAKTVIRAINKDHQDLGEIDALMGDCLFSAGRLDDAEIRLRAAIGHQDCPESKKVEWMLTLAKVLTDGDRFDEAKKELDEATMVGERIMEQIKSDFLRSELYSGHARYSEAIGDIPAAIVQQRLSLENAPPDSLDTAKNKNNLGFLLTERPTSESNLKEGIQALEEAYAVRARVLGPAKPTTLRTRYNLALSLCEMEATRAEGLSKLQECSEAMSSGENKLHAFIAKLGLFKLQMLHSSTSSDLKEKQQLLVEFLARQAWFTVDETRPLGTEALILQAFAKNDPAEMTRLMDRYLQLCKTGPNVNVAIFHLFLAWVDKEDMKQSHFQAAIKIADELSLFPEHVIRSKCHLG